MQSSSKMHGDLQQQKQELFETLSFILFGSAVKGWGISCHIDHRVLADLNQRFFYMYLHNGMVTAIDLKDNFDILMQLINRSQWEFFVAIMAGDINKVREDLENREKREAILNIKDAFGQSALHWVVNSLDPVLLEAFLEYTENLELLNCNGETPLQCAILLKSAAMADILLRHGANIHARDKRGNSVLHLLAYCDDADICRDMLDLLLKHKAYLQAKNNEGGTALYTAVEQLNNTYMDSLLDAGIDPRFWNKYGKFPRWHETITMPVGHEFFRKSAANVQKSELGQNVRREDLQQREQPFSAEQAEKDRSGGQGFFKRSTAVAKEDAEYMQGYLEICSLS